MKHSSNYYALWISSLCIFFACDSTVAGEQHQSRSVLLVNAANLETKLFLRLHNWAEAQLLTPVSMMVSSKENSLDRPSHELWEKSSTNFGCIIVLATPDETEARHSVLLKDGRSAIINVPAMAHEDSEIYARRLERQVMRCATFIFGLSPTLDPHGVSRPYQNLKDLDSMGRNLCPPWQMRFAEACIRRGQPRTKAAGTLNAVRNNNLTNKANSPPKNRNTP